MFLLLVTVVRNCGKFPLYKVILVSNLKLKLWAHVFPFKLVNQKVASHSTFSWYFCDVTFLNLIYVQVLS